MGYINTDQCDCCKEVWNRINLHHISLQSKTLIMCDDCLLEFNHCFVNVHKIDNAIEGIKQLIDNSKLPTVNRYNTYSEGLKDCLEILKRNVGESKCL